MSSSSQNNSSHTIVMQAKGLVKRYGQVTALDGTDFELRAGEILAVIGDNGAGKSSLIKALSGATIPDSGELYLDGKAVHFKSPIHARRAGIETVYQDLAVAPAMTIAENLFLGREIIKGNPVGKLLRLIDKKEMLTQAVQRMEELKVGIRSMTQAVETLSGGQRQCVAVARAAAFARHVVTKVLLPTVSDITRSSTFGLRLTKNSLKFSSVTFLLLNSFQKTEKKKPMLLHSTRSL